MALHRTRQHTPPFSPPWSYLTYTGNNYIAIGNINNDNNTTIIHNGSKYANVSVQHKNSATCFTSGATQRSTRYFFKRKATLVPPGDQLKFNIQFLAYIFDLAKIHNLILMVTQQTCKIKIGRMNL